MKCHWSVEFKKRRGARRGKLWVEKEEQCDKSGKFKECLNSQHCVEFQVQDGESWKKEKGSSKSRGNWILELLDIRTWHNTRKD